MKFRMAEPDFRVEMKRLLFNSKIEKTDTCWLWKGTLFKHGYGAFRMNGKNMLAHRVSFFFANGAFPTGVLRHTCDIPNCVRPSHLLDGTQLDNIRDMMAKGRYKKCVGENNGHAKLTNAKVFELRAEYAKGDISTAEMARREGMNQGCIYRMLKGITYKDITPPPPSE